MTIKKLTTALLLMITMTCVWADRSYLTYSERYRMKLFINDMVLYHNFNRQKLNNIFEDVRIKHVSRTRTKKPYEAVPWVFYKAHFINKDRINKGVAFLRAHRKTLRRAYREYGVPPSIIVAFLGVETKYGENKGNIRVIDALSTLAFTSNSRADYFRRELEHFLLLCREHHFNPLKVKGSYAGAIGLPQFMPGSYRQFAVDYNHNHKKDLINSPVDAIGSIANYLVKNGWKRNAPIVVRARINHSKYRELNTSRFKPTITLHQFESIGVTPKRHIKGNPNAVIIKFGFVHPKYWLGFNNFYVITRYNHNKKYAMTVYQLSRKIYEKAHPKQDKKTKK